MHAPVLRSYYLGGGHPRELCSHRTASSPCLSCELVRARVVPANDSRQSFKSHASSTISLYVVVGVKGHASYETGTFKKAIPVHILVHKYEGGNWELY